MSETPPEEVDADLEDPIEPRMNPAENSDVLGDGDGDDTLVSEGARPPPPTTEPRHSAWSPVRASIASS